MFQCDFEKGPRTTRPTIGKELPATLPSGRLPPAGIILGTAALVTACAAVAFAIAVAPEGILSALARQVQLAAIYWASIVLEALPFVAFGAFAASFVTRIRAERWAPLVAAVLPGCDCGLAGFAPALARARPASAGFALAWGAAANPAALLATHAVLGDRALLARLGGAAVAATLSAALWSARARQPATRDACGAHRGAADRIAAAFGPLALTAVCAAALILVPRADEALRSPMAAAAAGAILSPCSTADAVLARVLVHGAGGQAAFVIAAQCVDVRQLTVIARHFGAAAAAAAAIAGAAGCVIAWLLAA